MPLRCEATVLLATAIHIALGIIGLVWTGWSGTIAFLLTNLFMLLLHTAPLAGGNWELELNTKRAARLPEVSITGEAEFTSCA